MHPVDAARLAALHQAELRAQARNYRYTRLATTPPAVLAPQRQFAPFPAPTAHVLKGAETAN